MKIAVVNLGTIVSGDWRAPFVEGDSLLAEGGRLVAVGAVEASALDACDVVIDAGGATAIPGLIDSQVHVTFGDFTPRQNTVGYLTSYVHGGTTTAISASEVHVPGRPKDPAGVKALAVAAFKCFEHYRPGGMRVHGGSIILEPGLTRADFDDVHRDGVWLAKAGFGAVASARDYVALVRDARGAGLLTTLHTGGASIPGSLPITGADLIAIDPTVSFHINGGPVAIEDRYFEQVAAETGIAMQVCTAGNLRDDAALRRGGAEARRLRPLPDRHRHAHRQRRHAARHDLHHGPHRLAGGLRPDLDHRGRDRQRGRGLRPQQRLPQARTGRGRGHRRCPARRHQGERARDHEQRRPRRHRRRHQRRDSALRRPQPQHPADHAKGRPLSPAARSRPSPRRRRVYLQSISSSGTIQGSWSAASRHSTKAGRLSTARL